MLHVLVSVISAAACLTQPEPVAITNQQLIATMPAGTESVLVVRPAGIEADSPLAVWREIVQQQGEGFERKGYNDLYRVALRGAAEADIAAFAWGGSEFQLPRGFGMGNFNERWAIAVKQPLTPLQDKLTSGKGIDGLGEPFELEGVRIFKGRTHHYAEVGEPAAKDVFAAVPREGLLLVAHRKSDIEAMVRSALKKQDEVPEHWRAMAEGLDLTSAGVILRRYDPANSERDAMSPLNPKHLGGPAKVVGAGVALLTDKPTEMHLRVVTDDAAGTERFFQRHVFATSHFMWESSAAENGFKAKLVPIKGKNPYETGLYVVSFFGPNIAI